MNAKNHKAGTDALGCPSDQGELWLLIRNALFPPLSVAIVATICFGLVGDALGAEPQSTTLVEPTTSWKARIGFARNGVTPYAELTTEGWAHTTGGTHQRVWWNSLLDFGLELDTAKMGAWDGGSFLLQAHWGQNMRSDMYLTDDTGALNPHSGIHANDHFRVFNLHYRHAWRDDAVVFKFGQIAVDDDFMQSDYAGLFINSAFGAMPSQVATPLSRGCGNAPAFPIYPVAAPGAFLHLKVQQSAYSQLGLYAGRPGMDERENRGFDWADQATFELGLFWENGFSYRLAGHQATWRFGLSYHTGPVDDFSGPTQDPPPATRQTVPNFYLVHDFELLHDDKGKATLGLFCRGGITPERDRSVVAMYADAGLNWFGPLPGRRNDVAGLAVSHTVFGDDFRRSAGASGVSASETTMELTYQAPLYDWLTVQADFQWLVEPAAYSSPANRGPVTLFGLRVIMSF